MTDTLRLLIRLRCAFALLATALVSWAFAAKTTISYWTVAGSIDDVKLFNALARDFEKETGIGVKITPLTWGNFLTKYFTAMAAGLPPDIGVTNLGGPTDYGVVGGLVDLREEFPEEIRELESQFYPGLLPQFSFNGKLFGLPTDLTTSVVFYRTDTFQRLGIKPPSTWSEFNEAIRTLEAHGYHYYFGWPGSAQWSMGLYTMPYGLPSMQQKEGGRPFVNWRDPRYVDGIAQAMNLAHMHDSPGMDMGAHVLGMFRSENKKDAVPLLVDLPTYYKQLQQDAPELEGKWDVLPWPKADDGKAYNVMGGTAYVIFRLSKHKHEAFEWLKYLNSLEVQRRIILDRIGRATDPSLTISPLKTVWGPGNDEFWTRPELQSCRRLHEVLDQVVPTFNTVPPVRGTVEAGRLEQKLLDEMNTFIIDQLSAVAQKHGLSRWGLIQAFGQGKFAGEKAAFDAKVRETIRAKYAKIAPEAESILARETSFYKERYGNIINDLPRYEKRPDVLLFAKIAACLLLGIPTLLVLLRKNLRKHLTSYLFVAPPIVLAVIFVFVPAITALYLSFTQYHPVLPLSSAKWVGLGNYLDVFKTGELPASIARTGLYVVCTLPVGIMISLVLAFLLNQVIVGRRYWQFLFFAPMVTSVVSVSLIFTQLFMGGRQGWLNGLLISLGMTQDPILFLKSERTFLYCVIVLAIWHGLAFNILVFLAGLQQISRSLYEAAEVDGANTPRKFWNISLPGLRPQLIFISVLGLIGGFQVFETIYMLGGGAGEAGAKFGPNDSGMTMVPLVYHTGFETFEMGRSSAIAYILFAIILVFTILQFRMYREKGASE